MEDCAWAVEAGMLVQREGYVPCVVCLCENDYGDYGHGVHVIEIEE